MPLLRGVAGNRHFHEIFKGLQNVRMPAAIIGTKPLHEKIKKVHLLLLLKVKSLASSEHLSEGIFIRLVVGMLPAFLAN
jgi:hypothetical protein